MSIDFAPDVEAIPEKGLAQVAKLGEMLRLAKEKMDSLAAQLADATKAFTQVEQVDLPAAMAEIGMKSFTLTSGQLVEVKREYHCGITEARESLAFGWLKDHQCEEIIKVMVATQFGKGDQKAAADAVAKLREILPPGSKIVYKPSVHSATLKSFVTNRYRDQEKKPEMQEFKPEDIPPKDLFGIHIIDRAVIKEVKE